MRKIVITLLAAALLVLVLALRGRSAGLPSAVSVLEVLDVRRSQVTVSWRSEKACVGKVEYAPSGGDSPLLSATEAFGPATLHEVVLDGLRPGTRYTYRLAGSDVRYQFQTQPGHATPFSFLLVWGDISGRLPALMAEEMPEFILSLTPILTSETDLFAAARPYVPVYDMSGPRSLTREGGARGSWALDWGGLRLVLCAGKTPGATLLDSPGAHTVGVVASPELVGTRDEVTGGGSDFHTVLTEHNTKHPSRPVAFVLVPGAEDVEFEADGIRYWVLDTKAAASSALRVDVGVETVRAVSPDGSIDVSLREPPLKQRRTCEECRRLAEKGAYEESIKAYRDFIAAHKGHFQIDDAYLAIAEILDERLFRHEEALTWYRRLLAEYPDSALAPVARQRAGFLAAHADHDFKPLARFERIRRIEYARAGRQPEERTQLLGEVRETIEEFPKSSLAPAMLYWLANQYRETDPAGAVAAYRELAGRYPEHPRSKEVPLEIGDTYYQARRYEEAVEAYRAALGALPEREEDIRAQIDRARRNLRRRSLAIAGWLTVVLITGLGLLWPPVGVAVRRLAVSGVAFVVLASVLLAAGWFIHEQFTSAGQLLAVALGVSFSASFGFPFTAGWSQKVLRPTERDSRLRHALRPLLGLLPGCLFMLAGFYLTLYHVNEHYLIVFGL